MIKNIFKRKLLVLCLALVFVLGLSIFSSAFGSMIIPANEKAKNNAKAPEKSPVINENWDLEKVEFIHYAKPAKPPGKGKKGTSCYKLMGVKWKSAPVSYVINPTNPQGLSQAFITSTFSKAAETWDNATSTELFDDNYTVDTSATYGVYDQKNSIVFGDYPDSNVIGVTSVWYTRRGKEIKEFDQLYNTDFTWGDATVDPGVMDLENIGVHELGHAVGMDDIYTSTCAQVTMYGYSWVEDIEKRTLEAPDIEGLVKMYGP